MMQHKSKYQSRAHSIIGALLLVLMLAVAAHASSFTVPEKLADYLYYMEYTDYVPNLTTGEQVKTGFACSAVRNGNFYGRNLDLDYSDVPEFVIKVAAKEGRYASIGLAAVLTLKSNEVDKVSEAELLAMPNLTFDGINENGVAINVNVCPAVDLDFATLLSTNYGKPRIHAIAVVRYVLDNAKSAAHGVELLKNMDIYGGYGTAGLHWMLCDEKETYIIECIDGELVARNDTDNIMTNFYVNYAPNTPYAKHIAKTGQKVAGKIYEGFPILTPHACGVERYAILKEHYAEGRKSAEEMSRLMERVKYTQAYEADTEPFWYTEFTEGDLTIENAPMDFKAVIQSSIDTYKLHDRNIQPNNFWQTWHTAVYDLANRTLRLNIQENYSKHYDFKLDETKETMTTQYSENRKITGDYDRSLAVKCVNGTFVGKKTENIITYKGIPFVGKQPVGKYRWKAPVDFVHDDGIYEAYYNAKASCQTLAIGDHQGEDCLYLNVWKADETSSEKKPVMVWIHGGAFTAGGTGIEVFDCTKFVKENPDVIVVSIPYRLGVFGFLHLAHLADGKDYPDAQNLGLLDQKMALKWVHENIEGFGGDPDNVTIWGESAGAGSVSLLPLIEGSHEYFKKAIAQSGSPSQTSSLEESIACTNELMEKLGCKTVADLQKVDVRKLVDTAGEVIALRIFPVRDGHILPLDPYGAYADGAAKDIAFLQGCNKDEMNCFVFDWGVENFKAWAADRKTKKYAQLLTEKEKALLESYCNEGAVESWESDSRLFGHSWFIDGAIKMSENHTKGGGKSYTYYYRVESSSELKAAHFEEVPILFCHPEMSGGRQDYDATFSKTMRKMWVQFAKTGNPSLSAENSPDSKAKEWPLYDLENKNVMVLDEFDIHSAKESELKIVDWERTYFLTKYYML